MVGSHITTMASPGSLASASKESTDLASTCSATWIAGGYSTGMCSTRLWKTVSVDPSLIGTKEPTLICRGPRSHASPTINPRRKKPRC